MIKVTKFDGREIVLNADWIQSVEEVPDTLITLTTGFQLLVKNRADEVVRAFMEYKQNAGLMKLPGKGMS